MPRSIGVLTLLLLITPLAHAQSVTEVDYARAESYLAQHVNTLVYGATVRPNWIDGDRFWYRNTTADGPRYVFVDPTTATRRMAFDHARLADALGAATDRTFEADALNLRSLTFTSNGQSLTTQVGANTVRCDLSAYTCSEAGAASIPDRLSILSPDETKAAFIRDYNLWMRDVATDEETQLTTDGVEDFGYATNNAGWTRNDRPVLLWSPDSKKIATFQQDARGIGMMYLTTTNVGHPELDAWRYPLPSDSVVFRIHRVIIEVDEPKMIRLDLPPDPQRSTTTDHIAGRDGTFLDVQWSDDATQLAFVSSSRDHKEARLRIADAETGAVRDVMEEIVDTYYESGVRATNWRVFFGSGEVLWFSERDNWGHLYLYDLATGNIKNQITSGDWAVLQLRRVDHDNRQLYFTAGGREPGDPYFHHFYRVGFDGDGLEHLTPDSAHHTVTMSPSGQYFVDSYSTPTTAPVTVVRDASGKQVVRLEEADISALLASGWHPPVPFSTKARDGETDLYGLMYKPSNFDASRSYPVLNYLYPGPQSGSVGSRAFRAARSDKQAVAELGFIVVEVDAMGTPGRSKSFHDAYYGNMGDNGLPDQVTTIQQLGERHAWMDLDRVGIWGHSGGGFASTRGILQYPDFYKVAVSGAGNHDNRNYEDDWGEKWQGLLVTNPDGTTNYDNQANQLLAGNLKGKLLLAHGLLDDNVPPSNTMLMVDALVEANKDFDLVVFPQGNHGFGRARTYWMRKRWDYFVQHLLNTAPPKEYAFGERTFRAPVTQADG
ncbi:MAG: DPP IV N-terminal domain-containing protein [Bacteroidota bacterium]